MDTGCRAGDLHHICLVHTIAYDNSDLFCNGACGLLHTVEGQGIAKQHQQEIKAQIKAQKGK
jgi:hypothetical protein